MGNEDELNVPIIMSLPDSNDKSIVSFTWECVGDFMELWNVQVCENVEMFHQFLLLDVGSLKFFDGWYTLAVL